MDGDPTEEGDKVQILNLNYLCGEIVVPLAAFGERHETAEGNRAQTFVSKHPRGKPEAFSNQSQIHLPLGNC
jgi:hypothetical protein